MGMARPLTLVARRNRQEIIRARLTRRKMVRLGPLTSAGGLIVKQGLSSRAFAFLPQKFYQFDIREKQIQLNPAYGLTTFWGFDGQVAWASHSGDLWRTGAGALPEQPTVGADPAGRRHRRGTTHLHNAHTKATAIRWTTSTRALTPGPIGPVTKQPINPLGYKDQHYPNVHAGYTKLNNASTNSIATPATCSVR